MDDAASAFNPVVRFANRLACNAGETFGPRIIKDYQWLFVEKGSGEVMIGEQNHSVGPGCLLGYGPGVPHRISASLTDPFVLYGLHFIPDNLLESTVHPEQLGIQEIESSFEFTKSGSEIDDARIPSYSIVGLWALPYFEDLVKEYTRNDDLSPLALRGILCQLYARLQRGNAMAPASGSSQPHAFAERIQQMLEERAESSYAMEWLEKCTGYSHDYASKTFKEIVGLSPHAYHQRMKLRAAQNRLESTGMTITEIADRLHFGSVHYFCKWFRRMTGLSPTAYRKQRRMI
ncbi:helix-turn-helix domain-containing protein [Cohnella terricola]|uniref:AraC family transcriptional regulator n=1 Tax=Cohnella terricola TaxID=1289167 RepID=A0A559J837_9BACL|nr:AraC family transcriptional regulator [Cohnella terricola]TVX96060.1 AraC family transcriptional regulator [Cohnella terricola]